MQTTTTKRAWIGRILSGLVILFLTVDSITKFIKPAPVAEAFAHLGLPLSLLVPIGIILLRCTTLYVNPSDSGSDLANRLSWRRGCYSRACR